MDRSEGKKLQREKQIDKQGKNFKRDRQTDIKKDTIEGDSKENWKRERERERERERQRERDDVSSFNIMMYIERAARKKGRGGGRKNEIEWHNKI